MKQTVNPMLTNKKIAVVFRVILTPKKLEVVKILKVRASRKNLLK